MVQLLVALALLIGDAAAGLASGLARGLALTAAAVLGAVAQVLGLDGLDMLHGRYLHKIVRIDDSIFLSQSQQKIPAAGGIIGRFCQKRGRNMFLTSVRLLPLSASPHRPPRTRPAHTALLLAPYPHSGRARARSRCRLGLCLHWDNAR